MLAQTWEKIFPVGVVNRESRCRKDLLGLLATFWARRFRYVILNRGEDLERVLGATVSVNWQESLPLQLYITMEE